MGCGSSSSINVVCPPGVMLPNVFFITGAPGSGKHTQMTKVVEKYHFKKIQVYDCLKKSAASGSEIGQKIKADLDAGRLVSSDLVVAALDEEMSANKSNMYLIEGFPKNKDNIEAWNKKMSPKYHLKNVFYFHCSMKTLEKRLIARGAKTGRKDDTPERIKKRLEIYKS